MYRVYVRVAGRMYCHISDTISDAYDALRDAARKTGLKINWDLVMYELGQLKYGTRSEYASSVWAVERRLS